MASCELLRPALAAALLLVACGDPPVEPPPPAVVTDAVYELSDACAARLPLPNDVVFGSDGRSVLEACPLPSDPLEAALAPVERSLYAPKSPVIRIPFEGTIDPATAVGSPLALFGPPMGEIPAVILMRQTGTGTSAGSFEVVAIDVSASGATVEARPRAELVPGSLYVAVTTQSLKDMETPRKAPARAAATAALVGSNPIAAGAFEGLSAEAAARLEEQRRRIAPALSALAGASPNISADKIVSIHAFTVEPGFARLTRLIGDFQAALAAGAFAFTASSRSVALTDVFVGQPAGSYANVLEVHFGVIKAPRVLGDDGRVRSGWLSDGQTVDVPFSFSVPRNATSYQVAVFVPGFGRGKLDVRSMANELASGPRLALMAIELRCHGERAPGSDGVCRDNRSPTEIAQLLDAGNNGNPEISGGDGIPDASGVGFFPSGGIELRDSQLAAIIELMFVLRAIREPGLLAGITPSPGLHLIAHGHAAPIALAATAYSDAATNTFTLQLPNGGAGFGPLILAGPAAAKTAFVAGLPAGVTEARAQEYITRLESSALVPLDLATLGAAAALRLRNGNRLERALLPHPSTADNVSGPARLALVGALGLPANRISAHRPDCDDFFIYTCDLGDSPAWLDDARRQLVTFISSGGVTVTPPAL